MSRTPRRTVLLGAAAAALLLLLAAPTPAESLRTVRDPGAAMDATAPLVALLALLAWLLGAWLLLVLAVTAGGHLPGLAGRLAAAVARRIAPAAVRRAVEVALGLTVAVGLLGASPAAAAPGPAAPPAAAGASLDRAAPAPQDAPSLDWAAPAPQDAPEAARAQDLDWAATATPPAPSTPATPTAPAPAAPANSNAVVVQPGDSLWELAEQDLAARGQPKTDAAVAQAWPTWWAANREAVGDDPDLIQPGTRLTPPPADGSAPAGDASS